MQLTIRNIACFDALNNTLSYFLKLKKKKNVILRLHSLIFTWKDGELPVLPLSVYGAVAMAHSEDSEEYSAPYQFFFYLYDKRNVSKLHHIIRTET